MKQSVETTDKENLTWCQKARLVVLNITIEPVVICYILPSVMASMATQNLNLEKACRVNLEFPNEVCDGLAARNSSAYSKGQEIAVQRLVATAMSAKNIIQSIFPSIILLFLGSWSDRHNRRKPCILLPVFGDVITASGLLLCTYFFYEFSIVTNVLVEAVPPAVTGGWFSMFLGVFSYISNVSTIETRTLRIGAVNMFTNVSVTVGMALSGILYREIGFYGVFSAALSMYCIGLIYGLIRVEECPAENLPVKQHVSTEDVKLGFFSDFFNVKHIKRTFSVAFKEGPKNRKRRICIIMLLVMVIIGPMHGEMNVMYLFVRYKFQWNELDFSLYSTFNFIIHMTGTLFSLVFFSKFLELDDALLGMISSSSKIASCLVYAFAPTSCIFYMGAIVEMLNGTSFIAMRSIISKLVPPDELGKVYSLFGLSEALMPLVYGPMYSTIYKATIDVLPGAFFLAGGILTLPAVFIFFWLYTEHVSDRKEEEKNRSQGEELLSLKDVNGGYGG